KAAVGTNDEEIVANAEVAGVGRPGPLPDQFTVSRIDTVDLIAVEQEAVTHQDGVAGAEDVIFAPEHLAAGRVDGDGFAALLAALLLPLPAAGACGKVEGLAIAAAGNGAGAIAGNVQLDFPGRVTRGGIPGLDDRAGRCPLARGAEDNLAGSEDCRFAFPDV